MRLYYQILMPLLSLFIVRVDFTDLFPLRLPVELIKIYDGDTVLVRHHRWEFKLRINRIDSPETGQFFLSHKIDAGEISKNCLKETLKKHPSLTVFLEGRDVYGRWLGDLNSLSYELVENGCAGLYPHATFRSRHEKSKYMRALKIAKASRRGLWQYGGILTPKIWRKLKKQNVARL